MPAAAAETPPSRVVTAGMKAAGRPAPDNACRSRLATPMREYLEVLGVIIALTLVAGFTPLTHHAFGHVYLLAVILLCLRVGRGPVLLAAVSSALAWNYFFIPPRFSFQLLDYDDGILLGIYFVVALIAGQLTARIRAQERHERGQQRQATALYHLARALAAGRPLDEALGEAVHQAEALFGAPVALCLAAENGTWTEHAAGALPLGAAEKQITAWVAAHGREAGRGTGDFADAADWYVPMRRGGTVLGVLVFGRADGGDDIPGEQRGLADSFAAQMALLVEREHLRAIAEREQRLAESDRLHRTLFDSVSHELKTPLAVLRTAGSRLETADGSRRTALVREIRTATGRLDRLVANLLDQNRLESGSLRARLDWCDVGDLIPAARRAADEALPGRRVQVVVPDDMPLLFADAALMEHALANLLLNAAHHTPPGTPVEIAAGRESRAGRPGIFVRVSDRGPGLPPEVREKLFQKFSRGPQARAGGLGLGLAIVRGFMLAQGGDVTAGENPGGGACFTLWLPHTAHGAVPDDES